jgi:UDP-N-acetylmuramate--alanine ligase
MKNFSSKGAYTMYQIDFTKPIHIHFIGIGGISMSGLASILLDQHFQISGSDAKESPLTKWMEEEGASVSYGQRASNITDGTDLVVYTAAIHPDNPEYAEAVRRNIPLMSRAELLGQLMKNYKTPIAVSGTHGKTTVTSMCSHILLAAEKNPTISVGGILKAIHGNIRVGGHETFITEACEYTNSFLHFYPKISLILNIDADHLDFFKDLDDIRHSFRLFAERLPEDGTLIICREIENYEEITHDLPCQVLTYGEGGDYQARNISYNSTGYGAFDLVKHGNTIGHFQLSVPGSHNVSNALAALAMADLLQIPVDVMQKGLLEFGGTDRRFEKKGEIGGVTIIDDYAHHPTEIRATLNAAKNYPHKTTWCVFQPHTYTRTKALMDDFAKALCLADKVVLADIYAARETDNLGVNSGMLAEKVRENGGDACYLPSFDSIENYLLENCEPGDLLITMGAGDVVKIGEHLLGK